jgi:hypothetical protein
MHQNLVRQELEVERNRSGGLARNGPVLREREDATGAPGERLEALGTSASGRSFPLMVCFRVSDSLRWPEALLGEWEDTTARLTSRRRCRNGIEAF